MSVDRVKFQDIVESQLPRYVREEFPLLPEFLKQYYVSQEFESGTLDIIQNLDKYTKLDEIFNLSNSTVLRFDLNFTNTTIETSYKGNFTDGFPDNDGLIQIDNEIIYYKTKTDNLFEGCVRGFSGITTYISYDNPEQLVFEDTKAQAHKADAEIKNLNVIFLQEFLKKLKKQIAPGFDSRNLSDKVDQKNVLFGLNSFYKSKGTDESFEILFRALYGEKSQVIRPSEFLFRPSDADYRVTEDMVVEQIEGNPLDLINRTLQQRSTGAKGTITKVEPITYDKGQFYQIGIDLGYDRDIDVRGTKFAKFELNPKTKILNTVSIGSSIIDVDSTIGFAQTGYLICTDRNSDIVKLSYSGKTLNQFTGVEGVFAPINEKEDIRDDDFSFAYVGINTEKSIKVRVGAAINEFKEDDVTNLIQSDDSVVIKSIGIEQKDLRSRGWFTNLKTTLDIEGIVVVDEEERIYELTSYDKHFYYPGVNLLVYNNAGLVVNGVITRISGKNSFVVRSERKITDFGLETKYKVESQILKTNTRLYPKLSEYITNVQNTYSKFNGDTLVASNSIPSLLGKSVNPNNRSYTFSGTSINEFELKLTNNTDHGFYTGDAVFYEQGSVDLITTTPDGLEVVTQQLNGFEGIDELVFYVKRVDQEKIKLARSRSDIFTDKYVRLIGQVENIKITDYDHYSKKLLPQPIVREILKPDTNSGNYKTQPEFYNGIFLNGVEILNYKSSDKMYYGSVVSIDVEDGGTEFDVINPPLVHIEDADFLIKQAIGSGATGNAAVKGDLREIRIIDSGFDYQDIPIVSITGGAGEGAKAEVNTIDVEYSISFNAGVNTSRNGGITTETGIIGFSTFHKFADNEKVVYDTRDQKGIVGLVTGSSYHIRVLNGYEITLHNTFDDSNVGINTVEMTDIGLGIHNIKSEKKKKIVSSIVVTDSGSGYQNKKRKVFLDDGVNIGTNEIYILNHGYDSGQIINYYEIDGETPISGLSTTSDYYVHRLDENHFRLSDAGTGDVAKDYYYKRNIYTDLRSRGSGYFNYKPIVVSVDGVVGVSTLVGQDFGCKVQPIIRGAVESVDMILGGEKYGSDEILNFNRSPVVRFKSGEGAKLTPIISNGEIVDVVINESGSQYFSSPDLVVRGEGGGNFAKLIPITDNGRIVDVIIEYSGIGYVSNRTTIDVVPAGRVYSASARLNEWNINRFRKEFNNIDDSDCIISESNSNLELQISNIYPPRELRESINSLEGDGSQNFGRVDLLKRKGSEVNNDKHSPIIGWAYDGNPIYGPYGFENAKNGRIKQMSSSYLLKDTEKDSVHRPSRSLYPGGFFIEDYFFTNKGDLDKHNGRFCVTPDYPNGTYAYFSTFEQTVASKGPFKNFKTPAFPYTVGDTFKYRPNLFNFTISANQLDYDLEKNGWFRNTEAYHLNDDKSNYDYVVNSNGIEPQSLVVTAASKGTVQSVGIVTGGKNYQVNDRLRFNNNYTSGKEVQARVSKIEGQRVIDVRTESIVIDNVEFVTDNDPNKFIGFSSVPTNFEASDSIRIDGLSEYFKGFSGQYTVGVRSDNFVLNLGIQTTATTGITTYFYISGSLSYPFLRPNDILGVGTERVKVLNIDNKLSRVRVIREQDGTVGVAHTSGTVVQEDPRKFRVNIVGLTTSKKLRTNEEYYFIPEESVGVGTVLGVGTTVFLSDAGVGVTFRNLNPQSVYLPNHKLEINDKLYYNTYTNTSIQFWNGVDGTTYQNLSDYQFVYAVPLTQDTIGLSTGKVGFGTNGGYVGVNSAPGLMYFTNSGNGTYQSFESDLTNVVKGQVSKNLVNVSTAKTHGINKGDRVFVNLKPLTTKTIVVKYDTFNRRIVFDQNNFDGSDVDLTRNTITISDHDYSTGDKVLYLSNSPVGGLESEKLYFVISYDKNKIQLIEHQFDLNSQSPKIVDLTSSGNGSISKVNPLVKVRRNQNLKFDLSDSSLSFLSNDTRYSAFEMNLFSDYQYLTEYRSSSETREFEVTRSGRPGLDSDAHLTLFVSDHVPQNLWYNFELVNLDKITREWREYYVDIESPSNNQIFVEISEYNGTYDVVGVGSTSIKFNLRDIPQETYWNQSTASIKYETTSKTAYGPISDVKITNPGYDYLSLPGITSVRSDFGDSAILVAESNNIGNILNTKYTANRIGFDYPTDQTMRVVSNVPEVVSVETLASFTQIGIASQGVNYLVAPDLIVVDGFTNEVVEEIDLKYKLGDPNVDIRTNTFGLYPVPPRIIPTNNSNGVGISSGLYNSSNKTAQVFFSREFKDIKDFPFEVNDLVFIENTSTGIGTTGSGYNSSDYSHQFFTIVGIDPNIGGGNGSITYDMSDMIDDGEIAGTYDISGSFGNAVPVKHMPIFKPEFKKNDLLIGESVVGSAGGKGKVLSWNPVIEVAKISTRTSFQPNEVLTSQTSGTISIVSSVKTYDSEINTIPGSEVINGWEKMTGFMNESLQVLPNSEYYQNFSYSVASEVPFDIWEDAVNSINHPAGLQKFSDLQVLSVPAYNRPLSPDASVEITVDIVSDASIHCFTNWDDVSERTTFVNNVDLSKEIYFENKILTDHFECVTNKVTIIDDISPNFNSDTRDTEFIDIGQFNLTSKFNRMFSFIIDTTFTEERQFSITSFIHDNNSSYQQEYGTINTAGPLGFFDWIKNEEGWTYRFFPSKPKFNNYEVSIVSIGIHDVNLGIGTNTVANGLSGGNIFVDKNTNIAVGSTGTVVSYASTFRAAKSRLLLEDTEGFLHGTEVTTVHNGTDVFFTEFGQLVSTPTQFNYGDNGIGVFDANIVGGEVQLTFTPVSGVGATVTSSSLLVGDAGVGIGSTNMKTSRLVENHVSIGASGSPTSHNIISYGNPFRCGSYFIVTSDTTNGIHESTEVVVLNDDNGEEFAEFAAVRTGSEAIGTFGVTTDTSNTILQFYPEANIDVKVRVVGIEIQTFEGNDFPDTKESDFIEIVNVNSQYKGTELEQQNIFQVNQRGNLTADQAGIFVRSFRGDLDSVVGVGTNTVNVPYHLFETGDRILYDGNEGRTGTSVNRIGIAATTVAGVTTDKLPRDLYAVKVNDTQIAFAETPEDALLREPKTFEITSVGIGTFHRVFSQKTDERTMILLDNMIQSPIADSDIKTQLSNTIQSNTELRVTGITSFFSDDLIRIDDEYMLVIASWFDSEDSNFYLEVVRGMMGSILASHAGGSDVVKVSGQYNIVNNAINFVQSPKGQNPISTTTDGPDEQDWTGITTSSSFQGRVFNRTSFQGVGVTTENYDNNHVFDDISSQFTGIRSDFTLKYEGNDVAGISTDNAWVLINGVFQHPDGVARNGRDEFPSYNLTESGGSTTIRFLADEYTGDNNTQTYPRGGILMEVGSTPGFGYQPLVSAGGTSTVSVGGSVTAVSIGNTGSGYRSGLQTVRVGVQTYSSGVPNIHYVGVATVSNGHVIGVAITNGGSGYSTAPEVVIDSPLPYDNIPLIYSASSPAGVGTGAKVDITVGMGSSVIDFELVDKGTGYGNRGILTIGVGGTTGIPLTGETLSEFQIEVIRTQQDQFNGWYMGELEVFDSISDEFDGITKTFNLSIGGEGVAVVSRKGSKIEIKDVLLVFVNSVLQEPGVSYDMQGGSVIRFFEAPKPGDKGEIFFYKGTRDKDVLFKDILETVKEGDSLKIDHYPNKGQTFGLVQEDRIVTGINTIDSVRTTPYVNPGVTTETTLLRPVTWCKQLSDVVIDGEKVGKSRMHYEPNIFPFGYLIQSVGVTTTVFYIDSLKPLFDAVNETEDEEYQNVIQLISQDENVTGIITAFVNDFGQIDRFDIVNPGTGYTSNPQISIANPLDGTRSFVESTIQNEQIVGLNIISAGSGYTSTNPPIVMVEPPKYAIEKCDVSDYSGDYGIIVGFGTVTAAPKTQFVFDFYIPNDSWMRNTSLVSDPVVTSGIQTGDFFTVFNSVMTHSKGTVVTLENDNTTRIGVSTEFINNIYQVDSVSTINVNVTGVGLTDVRRVFTNIVGFSSDGLSFDSNLYKFDSTLYTMDQVNYEVFSGGIGTAFNFGEYSWGKINVKGRPDAQQFNFYGGNGYSGLTTSTYVRRFKDLKFKNYDVIDY